MSDISETTTVPLDTLVDTGLLFEINRTVLHPLGYALAVESFEQGGPSRAVLLHTSDQEGWRYDNATFTAFLNKVARFYATPEVRDRLAFRKKQFGYVGQGD